VHQPIGLRNLLVEIGNHGKLHFHARVVFNVSYPGDMRVDAIGSRMRGMRDSMAVVIFSPRGKSASRGAFGEALPGLLVQARGNPRRWPAAGGCLSYVRIRGLRLELGTHPRHAAATAAATKGAGMVRGDCHVSKKEAAESRASTSSSIELAY
jgi:hypothetical protein